MWFYFATRAVRHYDWVAEDFVPVELIPSAVQELHRACDQWLESGANSSGAV